MTVPVPISFPESRVLADWWRDLKPHQPRSLWVGQFVLHRLDGLVRLSTLLPLDRLHLLLLRSLTPLSPFGAANPLHAAPIQPHFVHGILQALARDGLAARDTDGNWRATPLGVQASTDGSFQRFRDERRTFAFLAPLDGGSPQFVNLLVPADVGGAFPAPDPQFDAKDFHDCVAQSPEWKRRRGFPEDVTAISPSAEEAELDSPSLSAWRRVLVDSPVRVVMALVQTANAKDGGMLGFWVDPRGWVLQSSWPAIRWRDGWREIFPQIGAEVPIELWRKSWAEWCRLRGLPSVDVEKCSLLAQDQRLVVHASRRMIERLRALRSDALKGEAWLLGGDGPLRRAALLEVTEADDIGKLPPRTVAGPSETILRPPRNSVDSP
jgi:hypothetical protein